MYHPPRKNDAVLVSIVLVECESLESVTIITIITIDTHVDTSLGCTRAENVYIVVSSFSTHLTGKMLSNIKCMIYRKH